MAQWKTKSVHTSDKRKASTLSEIVMVNTERVIGLLNYWSTGRSQCEPMVQLHLGPPEITSPKCSAPLQGADTFFFLRQNGALKASDSQGTEEKLKSVSVSTKNTMMLLEDVLQRCVAMATGAAIERFGEVQIGCTLQWQQGTTRGQESLSYESPELGCHVWQEQCMWAHTQTCV